MNIPNSLTLLRIALAPVFMFFFLFESFYMRLIALGLFLIAAITDLADGYYARKFGIVTGFGKFMDPLADKILVSSALIAFVALHYVSAVPVVLIVGREFAITGLRLLAAYKGVVIPPTWGAKLKTFLQMTVLGAVMGYICLISALVHFDSTALDFFQFDYRLYFNWALWITAAVTVFTGIDYLVKYFYMIRSVLK
ncbi:MAG: CDP-diacylglycerol--glycerol-3-phosphate 3-phosphatidyltransferase [Candidatus Zixiibacteriota bacterium]|nr:MAG: CDP-diacylglycerol--glycerol-3-phosphate 3-phosphatidyltransferase [candidate division Zixibacteria bacterium]